MTHGKVDSFYKLLVLSSYLEPQYKPMRIAYTKWSKDSEAGYYIRDHKANTWVNYNKRAS